MMSLLCKSTALLLVLPLLNVYASLSESKIKKHKKHHNHKDCICNVHQRPDFDKKEATARWLVHSLDYGVLSTISSRLDGLQPFGNVYSFVDGSCQNSTGVPYFYGTFMDQSFQDIQANPAVSLTLSEATLSTKCHKSIKECSISTSNYGGDAENPVCARLTLTGKLAIVSNEANAAEYEFAQNALFERHPQMKDWPKNHDWVIGKLMLEDIWLIDYYGGATILSVSDYLSYSFISNAVSSLNMRK